jgi:SAM-dependent methyltransferase
MNQKKRFNELFKEVAEYYSDMLTEHGESPRGVDWNSEESQILRFEQVSKLFESKNQFSVNDVGCGYGAFYDFLVERYKLSCYYGNDVSNKMIEAARLRYKGNVEAHFNVSSELNNIADFSVASGIFNVRLERLDHEWKSYLEETLDMIDQKSRFGFAFNCLSSYSDLAKQREYLYYADPCVIFQMCKKRYSRNVALLHDYGLYEFTILVKK